MTQIVRPITGSYYYQYILMEFIANASEGLSDILSIGCSRGGRALIGSPAHADDACTATRRSRQCRNEREVGRPSVLVSKSSELHLRIPEDARDAHTVVAPCTDKAGNDRSMVIEVSGI